MTRQKKKWKFFGMLTKRRNDVSKHSAPDEPELEPPDFPGWQIGLGLAFVIFFAALGIWRIVLEFIV